MTAVQFYYAGTFALSFLLTLVYFFRWHKHFDVHMTVSFVIIPISNLAFFLMYTFNTIESVRFALYFMYIAGCFLPWLVMMCITSLCKIELPRWVRMGTFLFNALIYCAVLTIGCLPIFYKSFSLASPGGDTVLLNKEYGPFHTLYYVCIVLYLIADVVAIVYSYRKKKQVSTRVLALLFIPIPFTMIGYFFTHYLQKYGVELVPLTYAAAQIVYLFIARRMVLYNVSEMVIESMVQSGDTGFITVDSSGRYLGSNETAREIIPELRSLRVDQQISECDILRDTVIVWLERFKTEPGVMRDLYSWHAQDGEEKHYTVTVNYLYDGRRRAGYQVFLEDDTQNQKYIKLLDKYNSDLQDEVAAKTERIIEMHDRLILGMATLVESRDNSTGGHIRRTSEGVRLLVDEMRRDGALALSDDFCRKLIKAAPMHDLGKIAVDDDILKKPGIFTTEEREKMKMHAAEGARIVHDILKDTDDEEFRKIAENVAHYHHEWVNGAGYPDGLKDDEIPLEARIMAIADVYDALVSKRVYKNSFSFSDADSIILGGMGKQFDAGLRKYYEAARPKLEAYYAAEKKESEKEDAER